MTARRPAGRTTYAGNVEHIVGEVHGPTLAGEYVIATDAHHDPETGCTVVEWSRTCLDELVTGDEHGTLRLADEATL